ncbi:probable proteasome subunit beta type-2 [Drosophila serrata]|uniref:probable proteasome subunit beta type-2 n=1 Tax=Drosophila serrata TaxID=7274 RepID=UPI000A1D1411|nr:probable proteasome subunit beta type-2 [Drosophila serrata]
MELILAIKGRGFVMMASTSTTEHKEMMQEKYILNPLGQHTMITFGGLTDGLSLRFKKKILRQLDMFEVSNGYSLTPKAAVHFSRTNLARYKRSQPNNQISMLIGGIDVINGPELHCIDSNGTAASIPYGVHGSRPEFCDTLLRDHFQPNLHQEAAYKALKNCSDQIIKKFGDNKFNFKAYVIKRGGINRVGYGEPLKSNVTPC